MPAKQGTSICYKHKINGIEVKMCFYKHQLHNIYGPAIFYKQDTRRNDEWWLYDKQYTFDQYIAEIKKPNKIPKEVLLIWKLADFKWWLT